jgi:CubicO group peptidase (beta-lactamase class C family)
MISFLALALLLPQVDSKPDYVHDARDIGPLLEPIRQRHDLPALVAVVVTSDGIVAEGYTGVCERPGASADEGSGEGSATPPRAVTRDDLFHLGSCTKAITATLLARSVEDDILAWDTTVEAVFPDLVEGMHSSWRTVTLAQLVSHTAGAPTDLLAFQPLALTVTVNKKPLPELRLLVARELTRVKPAFEPGTSYLYSNWGYVMASAMLETRTGKPWEELVTERLFEPLGMRRCGFGPPRDDDNLDGPCGHSGKGRPKPGQDNPATIAPAGTVHAPLSDWARFVQLHLLGARGETDLLLEPESFAFLHSAQPGTKGTYGGGWIIDKRPWSKGPVLYHNGTNTLWFAWVWIAPEEDFAVLAICNQGGTAAQKGTDEAVWGLIQDHLKRIATEERDG